MFAQRIVAAVLGVASISLGCAPTVDVEVECGASVESTATTFYASPTGLDSAPGTLRDPASLTGAIALARAHLPGAVRIELRGGTYYLASTLAFTSADSGLEIARHLCESPVLSGGKVVSGWSDDGTGRGVYQAPLSTSTRDVWVQGTRATRARSGLVYRAPWKTAEHGFIAPDATIAGYARPQDVELVGINTWKFFRAGIEGADGQNLTVRDPDWSNSQSQPGLEFSTSGLLWYENADELLTDPGYWYANALTGKLAYVPRAGEDMESALVVAGDLESLVTITGTRGAPASITFRGISFTETTWREPSAAGYASVQTGVTGWTGTDPHQIDGHLMPAAVTLEYASGSAFSTCSFTRIGAAALAIRKGSQHVVVSDSFFGPDIGGSAITLGDVQLADRQPEDPLDRVRHNVVRSSSFYDTGSQYPDCPSIFGGYVSDTVLDHNELGATTIGHIALGWGWNELEVIPPDVSGRNAITGNHAHDSKQPVIGEVRMQDLGSIYVLEPNPGTTVTGNWVTPSVFDFAAFYVDAGVIGDFTPAGPTITGNVSDQPGGSRMLLLAPKASNVTCTGNYWVGNETTGEIDPTSNVSGNTNDVTVVPAVTIELRSGPH